MHAAFTIRQMYVMNSDKTVTLGRPDLLQICSSIWKLKQLPDLSNTPLKSIVAHLSEVICIVAQWLQAAVRTSRGLHSWEEKNVARGLSIRNTYTWLEMKFTLIHCVYSKNQQINFSKAASIPSTHATATSPSDLVQKVTHYLGSHLRRNYWDFRACIQPHPSPTCVA